MQTEEWKSKRINEQQLQILLWNVEQQKMKFTCTVHIHTISTQYIYIFDENILQSLLLRVPSA